jgi:hypothetical protein
MTSTVRVAVLAALVGMPQAGQAETAPGWDRQPWASQNLPAQGWVLLSSAGLSWPNGQQAIVTFWRRPSTAPFDPHGRRGQVISPYVMRCIDHFGSDMQPGRSVCDLAQSAPRSCNGAECNN